MVKPAPVLVSDTLLRVFVGITPRVTVPIAPIPKDTQTMSLQEVVVVVISRLEPVVDAPVAPLMMLVTVASEDKVGVAELVESDKTRLDEI